MARCYGNGLLSDVYIFRPREWVSSLSVLRYSTKSKLVINIDTSCTRWQMIWGKYRCWKRDHHVSILSVPVCNVLCAWILQNYFHENEPLGFIKKSHSCTSIIAFYQGYIFCSLRLPRFCGFIERSRGAKTVQIWRLWCRVWLEGRAKADKTSFLFVVKYIRHFMIFSRAVS